MPGQAMRKKSVRRKLNAIPHEFKGKNVLLVDDSIVRGTTLRRVIEMIRKAGALSVHLAIHSPPVKHPCFYGIDMSTEDELFARQFKGTLEEIEVAAAAELGADSLTYLPVEAVDKVFGGSRCAACFDGRYPQPLSKADKEGIVGDRLSVQKN